MQHDFKMELVVTRSNVPEAIFDDALAKLREIETFAAARGFIRHFAIGIVQGGPEEKEKQ